MKKLKLQRVILSILVAVMLTFSTVSYADDPGVGITGYKWLKMTDKNQRAYVEGALDAFVYAFGITDDNQLGWSLKYIQLNMRWNLFMDIIKKHFEENPGQVHNMMVIVIKDALENGIPDPEDDFDDVAIRPSEETVPIMEDR